MSQQRDYKMNFWLGVGAIVGLLMVLLLLTFKKQGMDLWAGFIFGAFGGMLCMAIFLPAWVDRYRAWKAPTSEDTVEGAMDGEGEPLRPRGRIQDKKDYLIAVQVGLGGIVAAALMVQIGALRFFGYGDLGEQLAASVGVIAAGTYCLVLFIPKWAEKIRKWWHLESEDSRASEQGRLFRQLEHEQAAREAAELELMELRQQQGTKVIAGIKDMLRDDEEYRSLLERAEKAERMVESLDSQAREQAEKIKRDSLLIKKLTERLESAPAAEPEKPLHPSERRSTAQIIAALSAMAGVDLSAPYAADETLRASAAANGLELPSSPETVVKFLKSAAATTSKV